MKMRSGLTFVLCSTLLFVASCGSREETPAPATVAPPATAAPTAPPVAAQPPAAAPGAAQSAAQAEAINSYRMRIVTLSESARGADKVEIDGAFVKQPPAEGLQIRFRDGEQTMAMITVDGTRYMQAGDQWLQTPESTLSLDELTLITPEDVAGLLARMTRVGVEEVNGLQAVHYRGGKEMIPVVGEPGDSLDVSQLAFAELNLWVDQATNVVTRLTLQANGAENGGAVSLEVLFDYYDFNAVIDIQAPATAGGAADPAAVIADAAPLPGDALSQLLGFRLMLPTGSELESTVGATLVTVLTPFTVAEAQR
ncbi:MAG: hypothetical protein IAE85_19425, partial [Anaerolinea sp.]|nr:hypothetical protein [Anaerolinea sp.]